MFPMMKTAHILLTDAKTYDLRCNRDIIKCLMLGDAQKFRG